DAPLGGGAMVELVVFGGGSGGLRVRAPLLGLGVWVVVLRGLPALGGWGAGVAARRVRVGVGAGVPRRSMRWRARTCARGGAGGGYDRALRGYAASLREAGALRLGFTAARMRWRKGRVEVRGRTAGGATEEIEARRLVVTLPVSVLSAPEGPRFDPPLGRKREALAWVRTGGVVKALLRFREPFWSTRELRKADFFHAPGAPFPTWWRGSPRKVPLLTGWVGGPAAERLQREDRLALALDSVCRVFGRPRREVDSLLEGVRIVDWSEDPFSRGAYAYELAGAPSDLLERLAAPEEETLFFAGEATSLTGRGG